MAKTILKAEHISKQYRLGLIGTGTLSDDLKRWWFKVRGKEDPFLKIGEANDRSSASDSDYVWALQDINFEVKQGEVLGIIGKNGAGKSTLLKILSRVTTPTTGKIKANGKIASLLEVGTGFHPELTGKENIYLNGAILGMTKPEIKKKETEIINFSGCERYIDTPVKRYSSGMRVRLAFAVAAFLEPDILVIDEVLAVGDAEFQKKAIGKMQDISKSDGRTVLFVSHNMAAVRSLCTRAVVLEHGKTVFEGDTNAAVDFYLENNLSKININSNVFPIENKHYGLVFKDILVEKSKDNNLNVKLKVEAKNDIKNIGFGIKIKDFDDLVIGSITPALTGQSFDLDKGISEVVFDLVDLKTMVTGGNYYFDIWTSKPKLEMIIYAARIGAFEVPKLDRFNTGVFYEKSRHGIINLNGSIAIH